MAITASQVKELREITGLGMMACKKALNEADGNMEQAIESLRKQGQATAAKRASKAAKEGKVSIIITDTASVIYEVNSETDFVARNDDFIKFSELLGSLLLSEKPGDLDTAKKLTSDEFGGKSAEDFLLELIGKIGENISFRRFEIIENDQSKERCFSYVHGNGKIGVLVVLSSDNVSALSSEAAKSLGKDIAMQVAASNPLAIDPSGLDKDIVSKEREIYLEQAKNSGKPEKVWDRIVDGKLNKYFQEVALMNQVFIKDTDLNVSKRVKEAEKEMGAPVSVAKFVRFELGAE